MREGVLGAPAEALDPGRNGAGSASLPTITTPEDGLIDDIRPQLFAARREGKTVALATIMAADGGPRPVGAQMVITDERCRGFLSGGCIEDDVALHGRNVLSDGVPVRLVYGRGSPFVDMRLPCGGRIDVLVERIRPEDSAVAMLEHLYTERIPAEWTSDGDERDCRALGDASVSIADPIANIRFDPPWRLRVIGDDPFALAIAMMGHAIGLETTLLAPFASTQLPRNLSVDPRSVAVVLADEPPDAWTAMVLATHDVDKDEEALVQLLGTAPGYIGVLGARRRIAERTRRLQEAGFSAANIGRVHMPIGLSIGARAPWEVAVSAIAEIVAVKRASSR